MKSLIILSIFFTAGKDPASRPHSSTSRRREEHTRSDGESEETRDLRRRREEVMRYLFKNDPPVEQVATPQPAPVSPPPPGPVTVPPTPARMTEGEIVAALQFTETASDEEARSMFDVTVELESLDESGPG